MEVTKVICGRNKKPSGLGWNERDLKKEEEVEPKKPTNFLSLPLELRQQVYDHLLPQFTLLFDEVQNHRPYYYCRKSQGMDNKTIAKNIRKASPTIERELRDHYRRKCSHLKFYVNPEPWQPPLEVTKYLQPSKIIIEIQHYDLEARMMPQLENMRDNLRKFIKFLETRYTTLPDIIVCFEDTGHDIEEYEPGDEYNMWKHNRAWGDPHWCTEALYENGDFLTKILRSDGGGEMSIYEYLLEPLFDFSMVFEEAHVAVLEGILEDVERPLPAEPEDMRDRRLDVVYWLDGDREIALSRKWEGRWRTRHGNRRLQSDAIGLGGEGTIRSDLGQSR